MAARESCSVSGAVSLHSGGNGTYTYQWFRATGPNIEGKPIANTTNSCTPDTSAKSEYWYYCKVTSIEAATLRDMVMRGILPAVNRYTADLTQAILHKRELVVPCRVEEDLLSRLSGLTASLYDTMAAMEQAMDQAPDAEGGIEVARYYREEIGRRMEEARQSIDRLESLTAAEYWPYPTYADILFSV